MTIKPTISKETCITLDLETDGFGTETISCELFDNNNRFAQFKDILLSHSIKLTCFVVGKLIEERPDYIEKLSTLDVEFELHSYSHDPRNPDSEEEIEKGSLAYEKFFGKKPIGYRAPIGLISPEGMERLAKAGFIYDSSVLPTFRPDEFHYNHLNQPTVPYSHASGLLEIPMAVIPGIRLPITLSFMKLFGPFFYRIFFGVFGTPSVLVYDSHPYDYLPTDAMAQRKDWKRFAHARNSAQAMKIFNKFLHYLESRDYQFTYMSDIAKRYTMSDREENSRI